MSEASGGSRWSRWGQSGYGPRWSPQTAQTGQATSRGSGKVPNAIRSLLLEPSIAKGHLEPSIEKGHLEPSIAIQRLLLEKMHRVAST